MEKKTSKSSTPLLSRVLRDGRTAAFDQYAARCLQMDPMRVKSFTFHQLVNYLFDSGFIVRDPPEVKVEEKKQEKETAPVEESRIETKTDYQAIVLEWYNKEVLPEKEWFLSEVAKCVRRLHCENELREELKRFSLYESEAFDNKVFEMDLKQNRLELERLLHMLNEKLKKLEVIFEHKPPVETKNMSFDIYNYFLMKQKLLLEYAQELQTQKQKVEEVLSQQTQTLKKSESKTQI